MMEILDSVRDGRSLRRGRKITPASTSHHHSATGCESSDVNIFDSFFFTLFYASFGFVCVIRTSTQQNRRRNPKKRREKLSNRTAIEFVKLLCKLL